MSSNSPLTLVPAGSTNGTLLQEPDDAHSIIIYLPVGSSISYTIATEQPSTAPTLVISFDATQALRIEEPLSADQHIYVTAKTGAPMFRFV